MKKKVLQVIPINEFVGRIYEEKHYNHKFKTGDVLTQVFKDLVIISEVVEPSPEKGEPIPPGIYHARRSGYETFLVEKELLVEPNIDGVEHVNLETKIRIFLEKADFFTSRGLIPKRGALLHGPPGCGKTHSINKCVKELIGPNGIAVFLGMDEVDISGVLHLLEKTVLDPKTDKIFIVIEDLGGGEMTDEGSFVLPSRSSLLALLDGNSLPWKKLPTVILSTTNYPKNFLANILDRPGRFDEIIEFSLPSGEIAAKYAESLGIPLTDFDTRSLKKGGIGLAHVKEAVVRSAVYGEAIHNTLEAMRAHSKSVQESLDKKMNK